MKSKNTYQPTEERGYNLPEAPVEKGFAVPENYFDTLKSQLISQSPPASLPSNVRRISLKPLYAAAASLAAMAVIAGTVVVFSPQAREFLFPDKTADTLSSINKEMVKPVDATLKTNEGQEQTSEITLIQPENKVSQATSTEDPVVSGTTEAISETTAKRERGNASSSASFNNFSPMTPPQQGQVAARPQNYPVAVTSDSLRKPAAFSLGDDICSEQPVSISAPILKGAHYLWSNGSRQPVIRIEKTTNLVLKISYDPGFRSFTTDTILVQIIPAPELSIPETQTICSSEPLIVYALDNPDAASQYSYKWSVPGTPNACFMKINRLKPGNYNYQVNVKGCQTYTANFSVIVNDCSINIPNVFTPNGDGYNDYFVIEGLDAYPGSTLVVFDRNGKTLYESANYQNNWDARSIANGTYYYRLRINDASKTLRQGSITVYR